MEFTMRLITVAVLVMCLSGCKHTQKRNDKHTHHLPIVNIEKKEEPKQKVINISLLPVQNLTIKAF